MKKMIIAAIAATSMLSSAAHAEVIVDALTGVGFVGKGDVQLAYGWNNATFQKKASGLSFKYVEVRDYDVECTWTTVMKGKQTKIIPHFATVEASTSLGSAMAFDAKVKSQITGYNLTGFKTRTQTGTTPAIGHVCDLYDDEEMAPAAAVVSAVSEPAITGTLSSLHTDGNRELLTQ